MLLRCGSIFSRIACLVFPTSLASIVSVSVASRNARRRDLSAKALDFSRRAPWFLRQAKIAPNTPVVLLLKSSIATPDFSSALSALSARPLSACFLSLMILRAASRSFLTCAWEGNSLPARSCLTASFSSCLANLLSWSSILYPFPSSIASVVSSLSQASISLSLFY